jgi:hypothetical protein
MIFDETFGWNSNTCWDSVLEKLIDSDISAYKVGIRSGVDVWL